MKARTRRRLDSSLVLVVAALMIATGGPSLALSDLSTHTALGVALVPATLAHVWFNRARAVSWPPSGRLRRRPHTRVGWLLKGQDALREWVFAATVISAVLLMIDAPGETLHVVAGVALVGLAVVHTILQRRPLVAILRRRRSS